MAHIRFVRPAQRDVQEWKEQISIRSLSASSAGSEDLSPPLLPQDEFSIPNSTPDDVSGPISLTPNLCYACHTTLCSQSSRGSSAMSLSGSDSASNVPLPMWVRPILVPVGHHHDGLQVGEYASGVKLSREDMRELIGDSLLPDS